MRTRALPHSLLPQTGASGDTILDHMIYESRMNFNCQSNY